MHQVGRLPNVSVQQYLSDHRVSPGHSFVNILRTNTLPFKIPVTSFKTCTEYPDIFEQRTSEYYEILDVWLSFRILNRSDIAVFTLDHLWLVMTKLVCSLTIHLDEYAPSSKLRNKIYFAATHRSTLVMLGKPEVTALNMAVRASDLIKKLHPTSYLMFPAGCKSIPAITTSLEAIDVYSVAYDGAQFTMTLEQSYNISELSGRIDFIIGLFNIMRWIVSQSASGSNGFFHLPPGVQTRTINGHHVTLTASGILKEFDHGNHIDMEVIRSIYALNLPNVEQGVVVSRNFVNITRVGFRLRDVFHKRKMGKESVLEQTELAIQQLHSHGFAHCDICMDNLFVDTDAEAKVFIGDLEFCRRVGDAPPAGIRRADERATTAEQLDVFQLQYLSLELIRGY